MQVCKSGKHPTQFSFFVQNCTGLVKFVHTDTPSLTKFYSAPPLCFDRQVSFIRTQTLHISLFVGLHRVNIVHLARRPGIVASVLNCASVSIVGTDTSQLTTTDSGHTFDVDILLALLGAVAARVVQRAISIDIEVLTRDPQKCRKSSLSWRDPR